MKRLPKLVDLGLLDLGITDGGLKQIAALAGLRSLDLRGDSQLSNAGLEQLLALKSLKTLRLGGYQIDDDTLSVVKRFTTLTGLTIDEAAVTDAGPVADRRPAVAGNQSLPLFQHHRRSVSSILAASARLRQLTLQGIPLDAAAE